MIREGWIILGHSLDKQTGLAESTWRNQGLRAELLGTISEMGYAIYWIMNTEWIANEQSIRKLSIH